MTVPNPAPSLEPVVKVKIEITIGQTVIAPPVMLDNVSLEAVNEAIAYIIDNQKGNGWEPLNVD